MGWIGFGEILVIIIVILIFFGPEKMPEVSRVLAKAVTEFRKAAGELSIDEIVKADGEKCKIKEESGKKIESPIEDVIEPDFDEEKYAEEKTEKEEESQPLVQRAPTLKDS